MYTKTTIAIQQCKGISAYIISVMNDQIYFSIYIKTTLLMYLFFSVYQSYHCNDADNRRIYKSDIPKLKVAHTHITCAVSCSYHGQSNTKCNEHKENNK